MFHISCAIALFSFINLVLELQVYCYFIYVLFYTKTFVKCNFGTHCNNGSFTILIESLKFRYNLRLQRLLPVIYCEKCEHGFFEYYAIIIFLQKRSCKAWLKILPMNKSKQNSHDTEACASMKTGRRENVKFIVTNCKDRFTS